MQAFQLGTYHPTQSQVAEYDLFHVLHFVTLTVLVALVKLVHVHHLKVLNDLVGLFNVKVLVSILYDVLLVELTAPHLKS
jgi:hypothetical protein